MAMLSNGSGPYREKESLCNYMAYFLNFGENYQHQHYKKKVTLNVFELIGLISS